MKIKINYTFFGGSNSSSTSSTSSSNIPLASDNERSNTGGQFNWFRYNPGTLENELVLVANGGVIESDDIRNGIPQTGPFSQQCMYISIYDYLTLKLGNNFTFEQFKRSIDPDGNTPDTVEWDELSSNSQAVLRNAANIYDLDIRIWQRSFLDNSYLDQGIHFLDGNFMRPRYREGAGKRNIVNIAANIRHFELIIGGSIFGNNDTYNTQIQAQNRGIKENDNKFIDLYNDIINHLNTGNAFDYLDSINKLKQEELDKLYVFEFEKKDSDLTEDEKKQIQQNVDNYFKDLIKEVEKLFAQVESNPDTTNNDLALAQALQENENTYFDFALRLSETSQEEDDEQIARQLQDKENNRQL